LIGEILRSNCITQAELARGIPMAESTLSMKLSGERRWRVDEATRVLAFLRKRLGDDTLTLDQLFGSEAA
jgi:hypothetical protein